jgi:hypothetical protein
MLKNQFPMIFDSTTIPFYPSVFDRSDDKVSIVNKTEDGHDDVELVRDEKTSVACTYLVNDRWAAIFEGFRAQASIQVQLYNKRTKAYETKTMRIEDYSESMEQYSDRSTESMGLYTISFTLEEF